MRLLERGWHGAVALLLLKVLSLPAQQLPTARTSQYGRYGVGFAVANGRDSTRPFPTGGARPVQLAIWYPATNPVGARNVTFRAYVELAGRELAAPAPGDPVAELLAPFRSRQTPDSLLDAWLDAPMHAVRDQAALPGRFPPILIAEGNGQSASDQAALAEIIASNGYVVATTPSPTRITGPMTSDSEVTTTAEDGANDLAFAWDYLARRPEVDRSRVGLIGHSFGARSALLLAARRPSTLALVSLDGGIGTATAVAAMRCAPSYPNAAFRVPVLHFYETLDAFMRPDVGLLMALRQSERWLVSTTAMHHHHFTTLGSLRSPTLQAAAGGSAETLASWQRMVQATVQFLEANVRRSPEVAMAIVRDSTWAGGAKVQQVRRGVGANPVGCAK